MSKQSETPFYTLMGGWPGWSPRGNSHGAFLAVSPVMTLGDFIVKWYRCDFSYFDGTRVMYYLIKQRIIWAWRAWRGERLPLPPVCVYSATSVRKQLPPGRQGSLNSCQLRRWSLTLCTYVTKRWITNSMDLNSHSTYYWHKIRTTNYQHEIQRSNNQNGHKHHALSECWGWVNAGADADGTLKNHKAISNHGYMYSNRYSDTKLWTAAWGLTHIPAVFAILPHCRNGMDYYVTTRGWL